MKYLVGTVFRQKHNLNPKINISHSQKFNWSGNDHRSSTLLVSHHLWCYQETVICVRSQYLEWRLGTTGTGPVLSVTPSHWTLSREWWHWGWWPQVRQLFMISKIINLYFYWFRWGQCQSWPGYSGTAGRGWHCSAQLQGGQCLATSDHLLDSGDRRWVSVGSAGHQWRSVAGDTWWWSPPDPDSDCHLHRINQRWAEQHQLCGHPDPWHGPHAHPGQICQCSDSLLLSSQKQWQFLH